MRNSTTLPFGLDGHDELSWQKIQKGNKLSYDYDTPMHI
jgi:hypothetical protein